MPMRCRGCNNRIGDNDRVCPGCGRVVRAAAMAVKQEARSDKASPRLSPSSANSSSSEDQAVDLELEQVADANPRRSQGNAQSETWHESGSLFTLDPSQLRGLIAEQPELIEAGLSVYGDDSRQGQGVGYGTDVGEIDVLAVDSSGDFVVVMVAEPDAGGELVSETLQRMGWVRKHLGKGRRESRGVILLEDLPDEIRYAAVGVGDMVTVKTWRVALSFEDAEI
jgi:hypothetical protein